MKPDTFDRVEQYLVALIWERNQLRARRMKVFNACLKTFLEDLLNYPLERSWRESLAQFQEHYWQQIGLRLSPASYENLAALIERFVNDPRCHAHGSVRAKVLAEAAEQPFVGEVWLSRHK